MSDLPKELQAWALENDPEVKPGEERSGKRTRPMHFWNSSGIIFIRDDIRRYLLGTIEEVVEERAKVIVISTHKSKGIVLPVMQFTWRDIEFTLRCNFHDWKISVRSPEPLDIDWKSLLPNSDYLMQAVYFEGFPEDLVFPLYYANDYMLTSQFSTMLTTRFEVWTFFWLIKNYGVSPDRT